LPNALTEIPARIEDICLSMKADDYLDVPEMIENEIEIELSASAKKVYKDMRKQLLVEINNTDIESPTAATLVNKCQQISNGFLYDEQKNIHVLHENKLDALESIVEETESPILIFYTFKADLEVIKKRFSYVQTLENDSDLVVRLWNQGDVPILCCHPRSAGHGLNLQKGGNTIVWYGLTFSWELFEQANSRLHRQGQRKNVFVHYLLGLGTIDHLVLKALRNKERVQDSVFEQLKALDKS
jgi:SNF2 family DNA or RNA helicase